MQEVFLPFLLETESKTTDIWLSDCAKRGNDHAALTLHNSLTDSLKLINRS